MVHLLPNYDELLVAFRDRTDGFDPRLPAALRVPQVILGHVVVRDGRVVGRYRRHDVGGATALDVELAVGLDDAELLVLRLAMERLAAFLGRPVEVTGLD